MTVSRHPAHVCRLIGLRSALIAANQTGRSLLKGGTIVLAAFLSILIQAGSVRSALEVREVVGGLDLPVSISNAGDGSGRLFITLQKGKIVVFDGGSPRAEPFLDLSGLVSCCGERGLLDIAFHPKYRENGLFFVNYTDRKGDTIIARYKVSEDPNRGDPKSATVLLKIDQPYSNHNGGQLRFGPDGYLYIGMGDGGSGGDPGNRAQKLNTLLGKMLRIDVDRGTPYGIPPGNPFVGNSSARPEIWSYGLRNPWRFSFDRASGDLYMADVGQNLWEEVHVQPSGSKGGENYGWRLMEGSHCFNPEKDCDRGGLVKPVVEYDHSLGCSITGGYVYRGSLLPELAGSYLYADYCSGRIWRARKGADGAWQASEILKTSAQISTFGEDEKGEVYFADHGSGKIFQITGYKP